MKAIIALTAASLFLCSCVAPAPPHRHPVVVAPGAHPAKVADRIEDRLDRREDRWDRRHGGGYWDRVEDRADRRENRWDRRH